MGVSIESVSGSGPYGRVYLSDVLEMETEARLNRPNQRLSMARREPLSRIRRLGAERTARSFSEVPHFYLTRDMEADRLVELLERLKTKMDPAPSVTELLVLAVSRTLRDHPRLNALRRRRARGPRRRERQGSRRHGRGARASYREG